jgi:nitrite reductase/ring-hydroxylating ferredoxin subunit
VSELREDAPQPLTGYRSNEEWDELLDETRERLDRIEAWADAQRKDDVLGLLDCLDKVHRESLHRLVRLFKEGVLEQVATDPAIHTLLELYDLLPPARPVSESPIRLYRKDEMQQVAPPSLESPVVPHWLPIGARSEDVLEGSVHSLAVDNRMLTIARVEGQLFALEGGCAQDGQFLQGARLKHYTLICPHHPGCYYDVRTGKRLAGDGALEPLNVRVTDGDARLLLGIGVPFRPSVPIL